MHDGRAEPGDHIIERGKQIGDDSDSPETHLPPGQRVAQESGRHHCDKDENADDPEDLAAAARELVPYLADAVPGWFQATLVLYDKKGKEVAYADDYRFNPDPTEY